MEGSPDASGSKSNTHCSGFSQIPHERDLAFFPLVPTSHKGWFVGTKWNSRKKKYFGNTLKTASTGNPQGFLDFICYSLFACFYTTHE